MVRTARRAWEFGANGYRARRHHPELTVVKVWAGYVWIFNKREMILLTVVPVLEKVEDYASVKQFRHEREQIKKRKQKLRKNKRGKRR